MIAGKETHQVKMVKSLRGRLIIDMMSWPGDTGRLTVLGLAPKEAQAESKDTLWKCRCACGKVIMARGSNLRLGSTKSCGCLQRDSVAAKNRARISGKGSWNRKDEIADLSVKEKRVYNSVPIQVPWASGMIIGELTRIGRRMSRGEVHPILRKLSDCNLIREVNPGHWQRVNGINTAGIEVKTSTPKKEEVIMQQQIAKKESVKVQPVDSGQQRTPIDIIDGLMRDFRAMIERAEHAALEISQYVEGVEQEVKKVEQLKSLIRSIGV